MFVFLISFVRLWLACVGICIFKLAYLYLLISMFFFAFFFCLPHAFRQPLFFFIYLPHLHGYFLHPSTHFYKFPSFCLSFVSFYLFIFVLFHIPSFSVSSFPHYFFNNQIFIRFFSLLSCFSFLSLQVRTSNFPSFIPAVCSSLVIRDIFPWRQLSLLSSLISGLCFILN